MTRLRRVGGHDVPVAARPQLPAVLHGPDHLGERHLDAERGPGVAGRALPGSAGRARRRPRDHPGPAVPAHAPVRRMGWSRRRPGRQAPALWSPPRASARRWRWPSGSSCCVGTARSGSAHLWEVYLLSLHARRGEHVRQPRPPDLRHRDGGQGRPAQRREPEQHRHERRPGSSGPAIGGVLIATVGLGVCFVANAASYVAVIVALMLMRRSELHTAERVARAKGQLREGVRYVWRTPSLRDPLMLVFVVGLLAYNFTVILPLLAQVTFHGGAGAFAAADIAHGRGSRRGRAGRGHTAAGPTSTASPPSAWCSACSSRPSPLAPTSGHRRGRSSCPWARCPSPSSPPPTPPSSSGCEPTMRGRVMALYAMGFLGTTPHRRPRWWGGSRQASSPRVALLVGAVATLVASAVTSAAAPPRTTAGLSWPVAVVGGRGRAGHRARRGLTAVRSAWPGGRQPTAAAVGRGSFGSPRTRSPTMLRWISAVPPQMVSDRLKKNDACRSFTG